MSTYRDFTAPIGSRRAPVLRTVGTRERRSHLTAPRVPTVGIDIGGTKVMAGVVDADGNILEKLRTETPDKSKSPKVVEDTIVELVLDLSDRHDVHAVGIGAAGWVDADRNRVLFAPHLMRGRGVNGSALPLGELTGAIRPRRRAGNGSCSAGSGTRPTARSRSYRPAF